MDSALLPAGNGGSLLIDPQQLLAMMGLLRSEAPGGRTRPTTKAFSRDFKPLTAANYIGRADQLSPTNQTRVPEVAARAANSHLPMAAFTGQTQANPSGARFYNAPAVNPVQSRVPINATVDPINPFDPRNLATMLAMAGQAQRPQAQALAPTQAPQAPPLSAVPAGPGDAATSISALDPSFGQPTPETIPMPSSQGMPQMPITPPPQFAPLPAVPTPQSGPIISAPNPNPTPPVGGPVAQLRFPIGHTPAISMGGAQPPPPVEIGGPTPRETVPPAVLRPAPQHTMLGAGYRRPMPAQMPAPVAPPPVDDALVGLDANKRFMNGPGPGQALEYPPPSLPAAPAPSAPATIPPSPPTTPPQTGAAMPPDFEDSLINAAMMLSAKRRAMQAGAHG